VFAAQHWATEARIQNNYVPFSYPEIITGCVDRLSRTITVEGRHTSDTHIYSELFKPGER